MQLKFKDDSGIKRLNEPVSFGVPLPKGYLTDGNDLALVAVRGALNEQLAFGHKALSHWPDNSIKWLLLDIQVSLEPNEALCLDLSKTTDDKQLGAPEAVVLVYENDQVKVQSSRLTALLDAKGAFRPFQSLVFQGREACLPGSCDIALKDADGILWHPFIRQWEVEHDSLLRKTLCFSGCFRNARDLEFIEYTSRIHFYSGLSWVKLEFTILNSKPAIHKGGAWDLGDENAFLFKELKLRIAGDALCPETIFFSPEIGMQPLCQEALADIQIYQESSGHDNWQSKNHINREEKIPLRFRGYRIDRQGKRIASGDQAMPVMGIARSGMVAFACVENFWQNFPKAIAVQAGSLEIGLFPEAFGDLFELQPGERKTHVVYIGFGTNPEDCHAIAFVPNPLIPTISCEEYGNAIIGPRPVPTAVQTRNDQITLYDWLLAEFVDKQDGYNQKNIRIDEFGWRNFGDIFADHESVFTAKGQEFISHYNNQYDMIKGALFQFMRTGKTEWFDLARKLGDHVTDIDIYHTAKDKYQYNGGLFWHTDHHLDAHTATHRTISGAHRQFKPQGAFGGGPHPEHNYATGLLYLYWMTGHPRFRDAVIELATYIVNWLEGPDTLAELTFQTVRNLVNKIRSMKNPAGPKLFLFDGPCRASGNGLNTLLDAYLITDDPLYLQHAEHLIAGAVHPDDDQDKMDLLNAEIHWFYTVFLQALGRYLDIKRAFGQMDDAFVFARHVLVNYACWMLKNEYPYLEKPQILEFPNETWAAQDLRKSDIFAVASFYCQDELRPAFEEKSHFFFTHAMQELASFDTRTFTRPMALVMTNGMPFMEMALRNTSPFRAHTDPSVFPHQKKSLLKRYIKNLMRFSLSREKAWIGYQLRSMLKTTGK